MCSYNVALDSRLAKKILIYGMIYTYKWLEYLLKSFRKSLSDYIILQFLRRCKHQTVKSSLIKLQIRLINLLSYILNRYTLMPQSFSFIHFFKVFQFEWIGKGWYSFCGPFLKNRYKRKTNKRDNRHLWIIQEIICIMKLSLKVVRKPKIIFLLSKTFLFFFEKSIYFLILGKVVFIIFHFFCWGRY